MSGQNESGPDRQGYIPNSLINLEAMRSQAVKRATDPRGKQESTLIHLHALGDTCDRYEHEFIQPGGQVIKYQAKEVRSD